MNTQLEQVYQEWADAVEAGDSKLSEQHAQTIINLLNKQIPHRAFRAALNRTPPTGNPRREDVEDLAQCATVATYAALYRFDPEKGNLLSYLLGVVDGAIKAWIVDDASACADSLQDLPEDLPQLAVDWQESSDLGMVISAAMDKLPYSWKQVMRLRFVEGYTQAEVAVGMNCTQQCISRIEQSALLTLQNIIGTDPRER